ncbi:GxxExxY protein [candidate division KSB1 bacterium]|nr:GxxExxY protein [candidate division KSB1 bacterium]
MLHEETIEKIIKAYYKVYNTLGHGFLEKVYENAMAVELKHQGLECQQQKNIKVYYETEEVGDYFADLLVNNLIIVELKTATELSPTYEGQLLNYLKASHIEDGLLFNFGTEPQFSRKIFNNHLKYNLHPV